MDKMTLWVILRGVVVLLFIANTILSFYMQNIESFFGWMLASIFYCLILFQEQMQDKE